MGGLAEGLLEGVGDGDEGGGDGGGPGPAVGLDHVGVDVDGPRAEGFRVDHGAEAPANQSLDLGGPAVGASGFAGGVLPGSIAYSAVSQPTPLPSRNGGTLSES